jgi:cytochrome b
MPDPRASVPVWDIGVRAFHWLLVAAVAVAAVTGFLVGDTALRWHLFGGVAVVLAVWWRVVWGVFGPAYARFGRFLYPPAAVLAHLRGARHRQLGHNPLGALMVFALLAVLTAIVLTGAMTLGGMLKQGPLRAFLTYATGRDTLPIHNILAIALLVMIGLHLAGVLFESWRGRENLTRAMITGRKPALPTADIAPPARARPALGIALAAGVAAVGAIGVAALAGLPGRGVPPPTRDATYDLQCAACHMPFPPSAAPSSTWRGILADLKHHFGADASLSDDQVTDIGAWLAANSAEHWDTLASRVLRVPAEHSFRISDTPGWRELHRDIPAAVFAPDRLSRSDCASCHADAASGRFAPQQIAIPDHP